MRGKMLFTTGMVGGAIVGMLIGMAIDPIDDRTNRHMKRQTSRAFRVIGNALDGIMDMRR